MDFWYGKENKYWKRREGKKKEKEEKEKEENEKEEKEKENKNAVFYYVFPLLQQFICRNLIWISGMLKKIKTGK